MQMADVQSPAHAAIVKSRRLREAAAARRTQVLEGPEAKEDAAHLSTAHSIALPPLPSRPLQNGHQLYEKPEETRAPPDANAERPYIERSFVADESKEQPAQMLPSTVDIPADPSKSHHVHVHAEHEEEAAAQADVHDGQELDNDQMGMAIASKNVQHAVLTGYDPDKVQQVLRYGDSM